MLGKAFSLGSLKPKTQRRRRRWHWEAIADTKASGTVWRAGASFGAKVVDIDHAMLEVLFTREASPVKKKGSKSRLVPGMQPVPMGEGTLRLLGGPGKGKGKGDKGAVVVLLDVKKASNIEITLSHLTRESGREPEDIVAAINRLDTHTLAEGAGEQQTAKASRDVLEDAAEAIDRLLKVLPSDEECNGVVAWVKEREGEGEGEGVADDPTGEGKGFDAKSQLGVAERFCLAAHTIVGSAKRLQDKLRATRFKLEFDIVQDLVFDKMHAVTKGCEEVLASKGVATLMNLLLDLGNALNSNGRNRTAKGFTLDSLAKLRETRSFNGKTTALHYLVAIIEKHMLLATTIQTGAGGEGEGDLKGAGKGEGEEASRADADGQDQVLVNRATKAESLFSITHELPSLAAAKRIAAADVLELIVEMKRGQDVLGSEMQKMGADESGDLQGGLESFISYVSDSIAEVDRRYDAMTALMREVGVLFAHDTTSSLGLTKEPALLFNMLWDFLNALSFARKMERHKVDLCHRATGGGVTRP